MFKRDFKDDRTGNLWPIERLTLAAMFQHGSIEEQCEQELVTATHDSACNYLCSYGKQANCDAHKILPQRCHVHLKSLAH